MSDAIRASLVFTAMLVVAVTCGAGPLQAQSRTHVPVRKTVTCHSNHHEYQRCNVHLWEDVELIRQSSSTPCVRGENWGRDGEWMWVSGGCRGSFAEVRREVRPAQRNIPRTGHRPGAPVDPWNREIRFQCASTDSKYQFCTVDIGPRGSVEMESQQSRTDCVRGQSWGWNRAGIWVDKGCRAKFVVHRQR